MRVVTTFPAATEIACALGVEPVGVSHSCDFPPEVADVPAITRSSIDETAPSGAIDEAVAESGPDGVYAVDGERIAALDPDVVLTQGMCEVCAVDGKRVQRAVRAADPTVEPTYLSLRPHTMSDVLADIDRVATALGREAAGEALLASLRERIDRVRATTGDSWGPSVAVLDWLEPVMVAGDWTAELVAWAGGRYGLAAPGEHSRPREWEEVLAYDPDVLVLAPCGFDRDRTIAESPSITRRPDYGELSAVQAGAVWAMDGSGYLNRPGPRLVDTLEVLAAIVDPSGKPPDDVAIQLSPDHAS